MHALKDHFSPKDTMGKSASFKKRAASVHSRAAKRASSPSIDLDKSLKDIKPPPVTKILQPSVLAIHQGAGVVKKSSNGRRTVLSAKARRRYERGLDRAEAITGKKEKKVEQSKNKARISHERSKNWEELNKQIFLPKAKEKNPMTLDEASSEEHDDSSGPIETTNIKDISTNRRLTSLFTSMSPAINIKIDEGEIL